MNQQIKITLYKDLIFESVKNETYKSGQIEKGAGEKTVTAVFHEQAGDEAYHLRILERNFSQALAELQTLLPEYLTGDADPVADNLITTHEDGDKVKILITVSARFNKNLTDPLAKLFSAYIENTMLSIWWLSVNNDKATYYASLVERNKNNINRSFQKKAPSAPTYRYPTAITLRYPIVRERDGMPGLLTPDNSETIDPEMLYANPVIITVGADTEISYTLSGEDGKPCVDDIIVRCDNGCCQMVIDGGMWHARGIHDGFTVVTLFSRHNDNVFAKFAIRVVPNS